MENHVADFIAKYTGILGQAKQNLILSHSKSVLDTHTFNVTHKDFLQLQAACGLIGFNQSKTITQALNDLLIKLNNRGVILDKHALQAFIQACDFIAKTLKQISSDEQEPNLEGYGNIIADLDALSVPLPELQESSEELVDVNQPEDTDGVVSIHQNEYIDDFLQEGYENIDEAENILLQLEKHPENKILVDSIFRVFHTIKGSCGIVGLPKTELLVHRCENLIGNLKTEQSAFSAGIGDVLFKVIDTLREIFTELEKSSHEGEANHQELIDTLDSYIHQPAATAKSALPEGALQHQDSSVFSTDAENTADVTKTEPESTAEQVSNIPEITFSQSESEKIETVAEQSKPIKSLETVNESAVIEPPLEPQDKPLIDADTIEKTDDKREQTQQDDVAISRFKSNTKSISDKSIRIDIDLLDKLMDQIGELVLNRNQIMQIASSENIASLNSPSQALNLITSELQTMIMQTRMQPIRQLWDKFPRMARDLANHSGKKIKLIMEGSDTELDRSMLEDIRDPLMHLVRNSIDHGIELPQERIKQGKPEEGFIVLKAFNEAGKIDIEISDDGRGISPEAIKRQALEKGLITRQQADALSEREALELIFMPGLSTAEKITNISGRGVGMDVVKTNVESIGGIISIESNVGQGTTFSIKIPLTLVIIPVLLVTCGQDQFAIAQSNIVELVDLEGSQIQQEIELIHDVPVYRLRGNLLPLVFLSELLNIQSKPYLEASCLSIVIIRIGTRQYGLVVDAIYDSQEIVIKPLSKQLKHLKCYSGATIIGEGKVALVLDVLGIIQQARLANDDLIKESGRQNFNALIETKSSQDAEHAIKLQTLLVFEDLSGNRMAMRFHQATRLEEINVDAIEYAGGQRVVQYRGGIMPLVFIPENEYPLNENNSNDLTGKIHIIVCTFNSRDIGLVVNNILDIVEEDNTVKGVSNKEEVMFKTVLQGHVTDVIDVEKIIEQKMYYMSPNSIGKQAVSEHA